jgi:SAM-dependent methyltransferase
LVNPAQVRTACLSAKLPLDEKLISLASRAASHSFLTNAASHNLYLLLLNYLQVFSEQRLGKPSHQLRILDWGCGKGFCSYLLKKRGFEVMSCDIERNADDSAFGQDTPIIDAEKIDVIPLRDAVALPFESHSFDIVLSMGVLEHVQDDLGSLKEIRRILKPNGLFFCFFLPFVGSWTQYVMRSRGDNYHDRLYTKRGVRDLLNRSGFALLDIWHRQLFPKNSVHYPAYRFFEALDQAIVRVSPLRFLTTNIEFVAAPNRGDEEAA